MDSSDFPAAHSMDTAWFAVDRDGHVALFETGESGAAPSVAYLGEDHYEVIGAICDAVPRAEAVRDLAGLRRLTPEQAHTTPRGTWGVLVFLKEADDAMKKRLGELGARAVESTEGLAFVVPKALPNKAFFDELHARDQCLGCFLERYAEDDDRNITEHGVFRYEHSEDNWIAGPYVQVGKPKTPVNVGDLPDEVATKAVVYEGSFSDAKLIQPAEIWQSDSWGPNWLSTDGKTVRPFPGRLDEMDEVAENLYGHDDLVVLREPLEGLPPGRLYGAKPSETPSDPEPTDPEPTARRPWWKVW